MTDVNLRAEWEALAACLTGQAVRVIGFCKPEDFTDPINQDAMWAIKELVRENVEISVATICDYLRLNEKLNPDSFTFLEHAAAIENPNGEMAARLVAEMAARENMAVEFSTTADQLRAGILRSSEAAASVTSNLFRLAAPGGQESKAFSEVATEMHAELDRLALGEIVGYTTSFPTVDRMLMGAQKSEFMIITGPQGSCKSLAAQKMLLANAMQHDRVCGAYILEMSRLQWFKRCVAILSTDLQNASNLRGTIEPGVCSLNQTEMAEARTITDYLGSLDRKLFIDDQKFGMYEIGEDITRRVENDGLEIALVDYGQIVRNGSGQQRVTELSEISRFFRSLALRLNILLVMVAKMNKAGAAGALKGDEVFGTEIDGSSAFEYDASIILSMMMKKPELICDCSDQVLAEFKMNNKGQPKHKTNEFISCRDCNGIIRKAPKRIGWVAIPKSRDGEVDDRIPLIYHGAKLDLQEANYNE